jgi:hypothetical protein
MAAESVVQAQLVGQGEGLLVMGFGQHNIIRPQKE